MRIKHFALAAGFSLSMLCFPGPANAVIQDAASDAFVQGWEAYDAQHYEQAREIWLPLAEQGFASAQLNLGSMYDYGQGVVEDPARAVRWYRVAAEQGNGIAQFNLGMMYADGRGVSQDFGQAAFWYSKAADQNINDAQHNLGLLYAEGQGMATDTERAIEWLYLAGQGYLDAGREAHTRSVLETIRQINDAHPLAARLVEQLSSLGTVSVDNVWDNASVGTGWPIAEGYVVTNNHVVEGSQFITLINDAGQEMSATVVALDKQKDLALLSVSNPSLLPPALPLSSQRARLGTRIFTIGFPRIDILGKTPKLSAGLVSSVNGLADDVSRYQLSLPIQSGNSGGPLINLHGEVVGVITSMLGEIDANGETKPISDISYAVKVDFLQALLDQTPQRQIPIRELALFDSGLESLADRVQHSVMIVRAK